MTKARKQRPKSKPESPRARMLADCNKSGLIEKDVTALGFRPYREAESTALGLSRVGAGYKLPAHDDAGNETGDFQYRFFEAVGTGFLKGAKLRRYDQPFGTDPAIDLPPILPPTGDAADWSEIKKNSNHGIYITEGFKKAACITKHVAPCIGITGVWNWTQRKKGHDIIPSLVNGWQWRGRLVTICFDSDAQYNRNVVIAENRLARALTNLGALPRIMRIPRNADSDEKVGADDYITTHGAEAFTMLANEAKRYALSAKLHEMNEEYAIVKSLGAVLEYPNRSHIEHRIHAADTFKKVVAADKTMKVNPKTGEASEVDNDNTKMVSTAAEFLKWPGRTVFDHIDYEPGQGLMTDTNGYNTWSDPNVVPTEGSTELFDRLMEHVVQNPAERKHLWQWLAYPIQNRGKRINHGIVMWSRTRGVGKTGIALAVAPLHGEGNYSQIGQAQLESSFNEWQRYKTLVIADEIRAESVKDSKAFANTIKNYITADTISINQKFVQEFSIRNTVNYYMTSNDAAALLTDEKERRYFVIHANEKKPDDAFFRQFWKWVASDEGKAALFHKLLHVDLADFDAMADAPRTSALYEMVKEGHSDLRAWCEHLKQDPIAGLTRNGRTTEWATSAYATAEELYNEYLLHNPKARISEKQLTTELGNAEFEYIGQVRVPALWNLRPRLWVINRMRATNISRDCIGEEYLKTRPALRQAGSRKRGLA